MLTGHGHGPDAPLPRRGPAATLTAAATALVVFAVVFAPALAGLSAGAAASSNVSDHVQSETAIALPSLAPLVRRVLPAVVNISAQLKEPAAATEPESGGGNGDFPQSPFDQFLRRFFENRLHPPFEHVMALGSGFVIDPQGDVVTNNHVVGDASKVTVILQDGTRHSATIVGRDPKTDIALVKIKVDKPLPYVSWGDSRKAEVGDWVVAVGNPFGLGGTVTAGIISALGRNINEGPYDDFLQIDAPINRGNSGGPTFNLSGQVIGINTAIYSPSGGSVGIGFAIPSNIARNVVAQLKEHGHVTRGWLGVAIQGITPTIAKSLGLPPGDNEGALVASVTPHSPAAAAGIRSGDIILSAGGQRVKNVRDLPRIVAAAPIGRKLDLTIRRDGRDITLAPVIAELKEQQQVASTEPGGVPGEGVEGLGMRLVPISPELRHKYRIPKDVTGVVVSHVAGNSPAASLGIQPGDVIVSVDQKPATTPAQTAHELAQAAAKGTVLLLLNRRGASEFLGLSVHGSPG